MSAKRDRELSNKRKAGRKREVKRGGGGGEKGRWRGVMGLCSLEGECFHPHTKNWVKRKQCV